MNYRNPAHWRLRKARYRLLGVRCQRCDLPVFPPRSVCQVCQYMGASPPLVIVVDLPRYELLSDAQRSSALDNQ
jgi:uncharacterized OB-fold protein